MATNSMVPYSNPAGKNQTAPSSGVATSPIMPAPAPTPLNPTVAATNNPLIPSTAMAPTAPAAPAGAPGIPQTVGTNPEQYQQLQDIYGASGNALYEFMQQMNGVNSTTLQDYIKSLQPEFAKSDANLHASLGAGGVGANSSVTALGESNLQANESALIADESAKLLQSQESLQANLLESTLTDSRDQVSDSSGWNTFAQILNGVGGLAGSVMGLGDLTGGIGGLLKHSASGSSVPHSSYSLVDSVGV